MAALRWCSATSDKEVMWSTKETIPKHISCRCSSGHTYASSRVHRYQNDVHLTPKMAHAARTLCGASYLGDSGGDPAPLLPTQQQLASIVVQTGATSMRIPVSKQRLRVIRDGLNDLFKTFQEKQKAERPRKWECLELVLPDTTEEDYMELFCNPNACSTAFDAIVMMTMKTKLGLHVVTEFKLEQFQSAVASTLEDMVPL